ncbi:MAG TPA: ABC transporter substrate-binding protein [Nocardioidaceae bacterium]|nr:ABC transporter substrate-binding protein [Nocardioidaceae bacterium]
MKPLIRRPHRSRRPFAALTAAAFCLAAAWPAAVAVAAESPAADEPVVFTVGLLNEPDSLNPFLGIEAESYEMWGLTYDYMISYKAEDMSPQPGLAESWETSDDGLTWTFHIREGVDWSDGEPLTAEDIAFTYNRILDGGPESASWISYLTSVDTITAPDERTVVLELSEPNAVLPLLPMPILPEHVWSKLSEKDVKSYANEPPNVVGSGPFRMVEGAAGGSTFRFEANPDYWKGAPHVDEVVFRVFQAEDPAIQALKKGEIDFVENISGNQVDALEKEDGITAIMGDSPGFDEIAFNTGSVDLETEQPIGDPNPAVLDPKFRYALGFAIDREAIRDRVYQGAGITGSTIVPPAYPTYHWEPPEDVAFSFDPDRAGQLLDEAGYEMGPDGTRTMPDGSPIGELRLLARADSETSVDVIQFFSEWLADIGIESKVQAVESSKLTNLILEGEFDAFEWGWYVEPDPDSMLSYMTCGQRGNWSDSWYCNEEYDALYLEQHSATDQAARSEAVKRMQEILYLDAPYLVTMYSSIGEAWRSDRFEGFVPQPNPGGIMLVQYGVDNYLNVKPVAGKDTSSSNTNGALIGGAVAGGIALAAVAGALLFRKRDRATADDRE